MHTALATSQSKGTNRQAAIHTHIHTYVQSSVNLWVWNVKPTYLEKNLRYHATQIIPTQNWKVDLLTITHLAAHKFCSPLTA